MRKKTSSKPSPSGPASMPRRPAGRPEAAPVGAAGSRSTPARAKASRTVSRSNGAASRGRWPRQPKRVPPSGRSARAPASTSRLQVGHDRLVVGAGPVELQHRELGVVGGARPRRSGRRGQSWKIALEPRRRAAASSRTRGWCGARAGAARRPPRGRTGASKARMCGSMPGAGTRHGRLHLVEPARGQVGADRSLQPGAGPGHPDAVLRHASSLTGGSRRRPW